MYQGITGVTYAPARGLRATMMLVISIPATTGSHTIRSHELGVAPLATTPTAQYATTIHTGRRLRLCQCTPCSPARARISSANPHTSVNDTAAPTRIAAGNTPGSRPPQVPALAGAAQIHRHLLRARPSPVDRRLRFRGGGPVGVACLSRDRAQPRFGHL